MKLFRVVLTEQAKADRDKAYRWYSEEYSKAFADSWYNQLASTLNTLKSNPERCSPAPENELFSFHVQHVVFGKGKSTHRVLFTVDDDTVAVLFIRHQQPLVEP